MFFTSAKQFRSLEVLKVKDGLTIALKTKQNACMLWVKMYFVQKENLVLSHKAFAAALHSHALKIFECAS